MAILRIPSALRRYADGQAKIAVSGATAGKLLAARTLQEMGYQKVYSVTGGFNAWKNAGCPFDILRMLDDTQRNRYSRRTLMPEIGDAGQLKLLDSKVLVIGAGGLGSPAAIYLAAAGGKTLTAPSAAMRPPSPN